MIREGGNARAGGPRCFRAARNVSFDHISEGKLGKGTYSIVVIMARSFGHHQMETTLELETAGATFKL